MVNALLFLGAVASAAVANPVSRASCTFTDAASAIKGKTSCSTIILNNIAVPAGTTLDLTGLKSGTHVRIAIFHVYLVIACLLSCLHTLHRSPSRARLPLATRSGRVPSSPSAATASPSTAPRATPSTARASAGGTPRAATAARPSPSSSAPTR